MGCWYRYCRTVARVTSCGLWQLRTWGRENVPSEGGVVLASNHQSFMDPPLIAACLDRDVHIMARSSLFRIPLLGALIVSLKAFPIERDKGDLKGVKSALERLRGGKVILVFPEGTRTRDGRIARMKPGIRLLSRRADVPIVPVLVEGAYDVWPRHRAIPGCGDINVLFGRPFRPGGETDDELSVRLRREVLALRNVPHRKPKTETENGQ